MDRFALLTAGLALFRVLPVDSAQVAGRCLQRDPISVEELKVFGSCTWPLDPIALSSRPFIPNGAFVIGDDTTTLALVLFFVLGACTVWMDFLQFVEDEQNPELDEVPTKTKGSAHPTSCPKQSWPMLPTAFIIILLSMVAASSTSAVDHASDQCKRLPLLSISKSALVAVSDFAVEELTQLPGIGHQPAGLGSDALTVALLLSFILIGMMTMRVDVHEMAAEKDRATPSKAPTHEDVSPPSSSCQDGKRFSRCQSSLYIAVTVMVMLAMMAAQTNSGESASLVQGEHVLQHNTLKDIVYRPGLHAPAPCNGIVVLILSIVGAIGCKVCHSDVLDMQAEEKDRQQQQQVQKSSKKHSAETCLDTASPNISGLADLPFSAWPLLLCTALVLAIFGNVALFAWAVQSGWLQAALVNPTSPPPQLPGLWRGVRLSVPFASDEVAVLSLAIFFLIGIIALCMDFHTFVVEEKAKLEVCSPQMAGKNIAPNACIQKSKVHDASWLQYFSMHWRMVSCVVLLISMCASALANLDAQ